jgi:hypothetical protein
MQCVRAVKWFTSLTSDVRKAWKAFALLNTNVGSSRFERASRPARNPERVTCKGEVILKLAPMWARPHKPNLGTPVGGLKVNLLAGFRALTSEWPPSPTIAF